MPRSQHARQEHIASYYAASRNSSPDRPALRGEVNADVCVIGAGFTGLSAAISVAEQGLRPVVLEAARVGFGASGRNGGQMINGYSRDLDEIEKRYGSDAAYGLGAMALEGAAIIRERVVKYRIGCDLVDGQLLAALNARQLKKFEAEQKTWARHGHAATALIDRAGMKRFVASDRYCGGLLDRLGGHIHPLNLALGEADAVERLGGTIYEQSRALSVDTGASPVVRTAQGSVRARHVLVCGNAYIGDLLFSDIGAKMMPVSSQVAATSVLGKDLCDKLMPANACIEDGNYFLDYFRRSADYRLIYGGGTVYGGTDPASIKDKIRPLMEKTFPQLSGTKIDFAWSGNFALTVTRIPHLGRVSPTVFFSHGDSGHGVTTTHLLGRLLGEAVAAQASRFDIFASLRYFPFVGGRRFRVPLTVLGSWYYRLLDRLG